MKKHIGLMSFAGIIILVALVQFADSYQTELFDKLQSLFITEYFVEGRGMTFNAGAGLLNAAVMPCYAFSALAPLARIYADRFGKRRIIILNFLVMVMGLFLCIIAHNVILFAVGNAVITFATSLDIHYLYIADTIPEQRRGFVRGIAAAFGTVATVMLPLFRTYFIGIRKDNWRTLYIIGIIISAAVVLAICFISGLSREKEEPVSKKEVETREKGMSIKHIFAVNRRNFVILFTVGIATAGITFYNEPLLTYNGYGESMISTVLFIQPVITFLLMPSVGAMSDRFGRKRIIAGCIIAAAVSLTVYVFTMKYFQNAVVSGLSWGMMTALYFSVVNLLNLTIMESDSGKNTGKLSTAATYFYGAGDAVGMLAAVCLVKAFGMGMTKIILTVIPCAIAVLFIIRRHRDS